MNPHSLFGMIGCVVLAKTSQNNESKIFITCWWTFDCYCKKGCKMLQQGRHNSYQAIYNRIFFQCLIWKIHILSRMNEEAQTDLYSTLNAIWNIIFLIWWIRPQLLKPYTLSGFSIADKRKNKNNSYFVFFLISVFHCLI